MSNFWSKYLNQFIIELWFHIYINVSITQEEKYFNTPHLYTTDANFITPQWTLDLFLFPHFLTCTNPTIYWDATLQESILHLILFWSSLRFSSLLCLKKRCFKKNCFLKRNVVDKKAALAREKIKTICLTKKVFLNSY